MKRRLGREREGGRGGWVGGSSMSYCPSFLGLHLSNSFC